MKEYPIIFSAPMVRAILAGRKTQTRRIVNGNRGAWKVGDRLWVRETWAVIWTDYEYGEDQSIWDAPHSVQYRADTDDDKYPGDWPEDYGDDTDFPRWRPSIYMPRRASRILLEVEEVRYQELCSISNEDAKAEGAESFSLADKGMEYLLGFVEIWESIHGKDSWLKYPTVRATTFKVLKTTRDNA